MPDKNLQAQQPIQDTLQAGTVSHKFKVGGNDSFELYDYPGEFSKRFDGVSTSGGDQASNLQKIFEDNSRTVGIRMQQEAVNSLTIYGQSGHAGLLRRAIKFHVAIATLRRQRRVHARARPPRGESVNLWPNPGKHVKALPVTTTPSPAIPYWAAFALTGRASASTAMIPFVHGVQTAVVVGPDGRRDLH